MDGKSYYDPNYFGTDTWWKHPYGFLYTDSIKDFCEQHMAYWILDIVGSYIDTFEKYVFLVIYYDVENMACNFYVNADSDEPNIIEQYIEYTDLDVSVKLYFEGKVLMFPSDH
jgi:hypothetical protein